LVVHYSCLIKNLTRKIQWDKSIAKGKRVYRFCICFYVASLKIMPLKLVWVLFLRKSSRLRISILRKLLPEWGEFQGFMLDAVSFEESFVYLSDTCNIIFKHDLCWLVINKLLRCVKLQILTIHILDLLHGVLWLQHN